jgi:prepilin-type N-terminal cleavage/methylation domain-containing protein
MIESRRPRDGQRGITLVELLVAMSIAAVVSGMIILAWFTLQDSFSFTVVATEQRENAQQAMTRMVQEIRDTSGTVGSAAGTGIVDAQAASISYYSAFNAESAGLVTTDGTGDGEDTSGAGYLPPLGGFYLEDGTLYRWRDTDGTQELSEADRRDVLLRHVVNGDDAPLFRYTCINTGHGEAPYGTPLGARFTTTSPGRLASVVSVEIVLRVDLNVGHSPTYMDLISTAQPRNHRQT